MSPRDPRPKVDRDSSAIDGIQFQQTLLGDKIDIQNIELTNLSDRVSASLKLVDTVMHRLDQNQKVIQTEILPLNNRLHNIESFLSSFNGKPDTSAH